MTKYFLLCALLVIGLVSVAAPRSVQAVADPPAVGSLAPEFSLVTNEGKPASLKDFRGKWVVLYFYPKDFTSGCTIEAKNFQRDLAKYEAANAVILGVSLDTADSHKDSAPRKA